MFTFVAHVIDTANRLHCITVEAPRHQGVKVAARRIAKAQGVEVKYIECVFIASPTVV